MPYRRILGAAVLVTALFGLTACIPPSTAAPSTSAPPVATATPTASPEPLAMRPANLTGTTCADAIALDLLEAAAGTALQAGGALVSEFDTATWRARWEYAGGLYCPWSDPATGEVRAIVSILPDGAPAGLRMGVEIADMTGNESMEEVRPLTAGCIYDYCHIGGYVGEHFANVMVLGQPWNDGSGEATPEMLAIRDAIAAVLGSVPSEGGLPPLSTAWIDGPTTCDELLPVDELAAAMGSGSAGYAPGYAYEESTGVDGALLTAGGLTCRYRPGDEEPATGLISVLPDAGAAFRAAAATPGREPGSAPDTLWSCRRNGPAEVEASVSCTVDVLAGDAWVTVSANGYQDEDAVRERALAVAAAVGAAVGAL